MTTPDASSASSTSPRSARRSATGGGSSAPSRSDGAGTKPAAKPSKRGRSSRVAASTVGDPVRIEDLRRLTTVSGASMSRDGSRVAFVRRTVCRRAESRSDIWMASLAGDPSMSGDVRRFTNSGKDSQPGLSPDGQTLAFVSKRSGAAQLHTMPADGGEPIALTDLPEGTIRSWKWSPDGARIAMAYRETEQGFRQEDIKRRTNGSGESEPPRIIDDLWYRNDGDGYFGRQRFKLHLVDAASGKAEVLHENDRLGLFDYAFSPDGSTIAITTNRHKRAMLEPKHTTIELVDVASGRVRVLSALPAGPKGGLCFSPDGSQIAFGGREGEDGLYSTENVNLWIADVETGDAASLLDKHDLCLMAMSIGDTGDPDFAPWLRFAPNGKRLVFRVGLHGATQIASVTTTGRSLTFHTSGEAEHDALDIGGAGVGTVVLAHATPRHPQELATLDLSAAPKRTLDDLLDEPADGSTPDLSERTSNPAITVRTSFNAGYERATDGAAPTNHWVEAEDGTLVHVRVLLPPDGAESRGKGAASSNGRGRSRTKAWPAALMIHGGPHAQFGSGFFHEMQALAAEGFVVVYPNPRGSKGYGRDFCDAIRGAWGGKDWDDVRATIAFMQQHPSIDAERMSIMGGSYGGYITNYAIGQTDVFKAAISDRCVSNLVSHLGNSDYYHKPGRYFPGNFWCDNEELWRQSPIRFVDNVATPTLVIHSEGDLRCNVEQGEQLFAALQIRGVPSRMVRYPRSTFHGMSRNGPVDLREHRLRQMLEWLRKWV